MRKSAKEDLSLGWQVDGHSATILAPLAASKVTVEETGGAEAALRGVERLWPFGGPKRQALELFFERSLPRTLPTFEAEASRPGRGVSAMSQSPRASPKR